MAVPLFNLAPDMSVSRLCLGTMTFGEQNSLLQSFQILDKAFDSGINFFDSAEMYPVPQRADTQGRSEEYLGRWIRSRNIPRHRLVLATKVCGPSGQMTWIRKGPESLDARNIAEALDHSLLRLQSDYIDLFQIHWPDRYVPMFGEIEFDPTRTFSSVSFEEQLTAIDKASCAAECCHYERVSLLAYSPLAMGILSGKYLSNDGGPADARLNLFKGRYAEGESRYNLSNGVIKKVTGLYISIAKKYGIHPVSLAIAFVLRHPIVASAVFGATKLWQIEEVVNGCRVELAPEIVAEINNVHSAFPNPCP